jgi:hypothetical protein
VPDAAPTPGNIRKSLKTKGKRADDHGLPYLIQPLRPGALSGVLKHFFDDCLE